MKLHLGCGKNIKEGWANLDRNTTHGATYWKAPTLPFNDDSVDFVYSEHFIEHLFREDCDFLFQEVRRVLRPGCTFRVSTPSIKTIIHDYLKMDSDDDFTRHEQVGFKYKTPAEFINRSFRDWDHLFIYDGSELLNVALYAGFTNINIAPYSREYETRPEMGDLIMEFQK